MSALRWLLEDRNSGRTVIAQRPNAPLALSYALGTLRGLTKRSEVDPLLLGALAYWSALEILKGVNPFRRLLGAATLSIVVVLSRAKFRCRCAGDGSAAER